MRQLENNMQIKGGLLCAITLCAVFGGCVSRPSYQEQTPLEVRSLQTREFPGVDYSIVIKAIINVLQDDGYMIRNAVADLGLITASKETDWTKGWGDVLSFLALFGEDRDNDKVWPQTDRIEATVNVSRFGNRVRVRVSFQRKIIDSRGVLMETKDILDSAFYQNFMAKVDKGIFIEKEGV